MPDMTPPPTTLDLTGLPSTVVVSLRLLVEALRQATPVDPAARKTLRGAGADLGLSIPPEHIAEAQRECWATMPPYAEES